MADKTGIEWTDATWNPVRGCSRVSEGCRNCYAERVAYRFSGERIDGRPAPYSGLVQRTPDGMRLPLWNGNIKFVEEHLLDPLNWKKPRRIFVNSMSDLFHENVTDVMRDRIFAVMALCPQHTFQVLTKRPGQMLTYLQSACGRIADQVMAIRKKRGDRGCIAPLPHISLGAAWWPLANVWLGVSVENQKAADERIPLLLQTPAAKRFISAEPLLGAVDLRWWTGTYCPHDDSYEEEDTGATICKKCDEEAVLDWVIIGGESGPRARPMHPDWARGLRDQCKAAGVPFFFKQWGEWLHIPLVEDSRKFTCTLEYFRDMDASFARVGKKAAGALLDGVEYREFPQ